MNNQDLQCHLLLYHSTSSHLPPDQSPPGLLLCRLAARLQPSCGIDSQHLQTGNLAAKRSNIGLFLQVSLLLQHLPNSCPGQAAASYGVPQHLLFQPDDLAVMAHTYR